MNTNKLIQNKSSQKKLRSFFISTGFLTNGLSLIGILFLFTGIAIVNRLPPNNSNDLYIGVVTAISFPWFICSCIFIVLRKEIPRWGLQSIIGKWAISQGYLGIILFSIIEVVVLILLFNKLLAFFVLFHIK